MLQLPVVLKKALGLRLTIEERRRIALRKEHRERAERQGEINGRHQAAMDGVRQFCQDMREFLNGRGECSYQEEFPDDPFSYVVTIRFDARWHNQEAGEIYVSISAEPWAMLVRRSSRAGARWAHASGPRVLSPMLQTLWNSEVKPGKVEDFTEKLLEWLFQQERRHSFRWSVRHKA